MFVHRLIYLSNKAPGLNAGDLADILETSRRNNRMRDVTGMLIVTRKMFIQALEGSEGAVHEIFDRIRRDVRHTDVHAIIDAKAPSRAFPDWSMGFSEQSDEALRDQAKLLGIMSTAETFDALNAEPSIATSLLAKLSTDQSGHAFL